MTFNDLEWPIVTFKGLHKGMSINIFPIFSEKTCLQMSRNLFLTLKWPQMT